MIYCVQLIKERLEIFSQESKLVLVRKSVDFYLEDTLNFVCDDDFDEKDLKSACYTLGFKDGRNWQTIDQGDFWTESEIPFLRDDMDCRSFTSDFLSCGYSPENCRHTENVLVICDD